jgi:hypothetical protein
VYAAYEAEKRDGFPVFGMNLDPEARSAVARAVIIDLLEEHSGLLRDIRAWLAVLVSVVSALL